MLRPTLAWFGLFALAFINGALREFALKKWLAIPDLLAHQISCFTGVVLWTGFVLLVWKKLEITHLKQAAFIGLGWFFATFMFETFILNHKLSWPEILHTYDVSSGELWGLVLLWIGFLPVVVFWLKHLICHALCRLTI